MSRSSLDKYSASEGEEATPGNIFENRFKIEWARNHGGRKPHWGGASLGQLIDNNTSLDAFGARSPDGVDDIGHLSESDISRWVDKLAGLNGLGYGEKLREQGFCTSQSIMLLTVEIATGIGIKLGHALQVISAAQARFSKDGRNAADVPRGEPGISIGEVNTMNNEGKLEIVLDGLENCHIGGSGRPFRCRLYLQPKELPLSVSAHKMGWLVRGNQEASGDWKTV